MEFEKAIRADTERFLLIDFLRQRYESRGPTWREAPCIDGNLPTGDVPTVRLFRDQLEKFRDDYALVVAFAAHVCGVALQEFSPLHLAMYLHREAALKSEEGPKEAEP